MGHPKSHLYTKSIEICPRTKDQRSWAWWCTPVITALGRLRQEDQCEFETSLGHKSELKASLNCIARPYLKKKKKKKRI